MSSKKELQEKYNNMLLLMKEVLEDKPSAVKKANELLKEEGLVEEPEMKWLGGNP